MTLFSIGIGFGAAQLQVQQNVTIIGVNLAGITTGITTSCPTTGYTDIGLTLVWPNMLPGSSSTVNMCIANIGGGTTTLSFSTVGLPAGLTFSSGSANGTSLAAGATLLVALTLTASSTLAPGTYSFTTNIA